MSEQALVVSVVVASVLLMLTVALALAPDPLPQKVHVASPVDGCREATNTVSWTGSDSVYRWFVCPPLTEDE